MATRTRKRAKRSFAARHGAAISAGVTAVVLLAIVAAFMPGASSDDAPPPPGRWFDDRAGMVSFAFASGKSTYLQSYVLEALHLAVLVVTEPKAPASVEAYTSEAVASWKIGAHGADNGIVLFVFPSVRTARLEIGYGLEGVIPDLEAGRLLEAQLLPKFSAGKYEEGFEDFLDVLVKRLQANEKESVKRDKLIGIVDYAWGIVRQAPRLARAGWSLFKGAEWQGRAILAIFAGVLASLLGYALTWMAMGLWALVQIPWRLAHGTAWRAIDRKKLAAELAFPEAARRPPPSLVAAWDELHLDDVVLGLLAAACVVVGIAFLGLGTQTVMEGHGGFSGAGITAKWL
jgi:uncharacterized membrane protein YgcG